MTALEAERAKLLRDYDTAKEQGGDDAVKTEHGVSCESLFRAFLDQFLPKKYGVTKGYVITSDMDYAGPLEEWDVIIYDALESPVLFVRKTADDQNGKRGIPVEYVKAIIEVKATFNKTMAEKAATKLLKLRQFKRKAEGKVMPWEKTCYLSDFSAHAIFFETKVRDASDYAAALGALAPFWQTDPMTEFRGALIIRGQEPPHYSAQLDHVLTPMENVGDWLAPCCEISAGFESFVADGLKTVATKPKGYVVSGGFGYNEFWSYMISLVHALNGEDREEYFGPPPRMREGYGVKGDGYSRAKLFGGPPSD